MFEVLNDLSLINNPSQLADVESRHDRDPQTRLIRVWPALGVTC